MCRRQDARGESVAEKVRADESGQSLIEVGQIGEPAAEDDDLGIEDVDDGCEPAGEAVGVTLQGRGGGRVAALTVEKVDGAASLGADHPFVHALLAAGFHQTPKGVRLRR